MTKRIRLPALCIAYSHVTVIELVLTGTPPRQAFDAACRMHYNSIIAAALDSPAGLKWGVTPWLHPATCWPPGDWFFPLPDATRRWTTRCFTESAAEVHQLLTADADDLGDTSIDEELAGTLAWMEETLRRFASGGGTLPASARGAIDTAAGRPRRHRTPVDDVWLANQASTALDNLWQVLAPVIAPGRATRPHPGDRPATTPGGVSWTTVHLMGRGG